MTFTLRLVSDGPAPVTAAVSTTFPADLGTAPALAWTGVLPRRSADLHPAGDPGGGTSAGDGRPAHAHIALAEQGIVFSRTAWVRAGAPDLGPRRWNAGLGRARRSGNLHPAPGERRSANALTATAEVTGAPADRRATHFGSARRVVGPGLARFLRAARSP